LTILQAPWRASFDSMKAQEGSGVVFKETVLMVEDCEDSRSVFRMMLKTLGYQVIVASDAEQATQLSQDHEGSIDLLLTDVMLPGANGRELANLLCKADPGLRVILMSGYPAEQIASEGRPFLQKPFTMQTAGALIRRTLDGEPRFDDASPGAPKGLM
jgi:DNA-binding NtrC family response regulator